MEATAQHLGEAGMLDRLPERRAGVWKRRVAILLGVAAVCCVGRVGVPAGAALLSSTLPQVRQTLPQVFGTNMAAQRAPMSNVQMINLFGNNEESRARREALSFRDARAGDRKVTFRKPNQATDGLVLGLKFKEKFGKSVFIDKIVPKTEAARLEKQGKIKVGDEVTMVSATFGDEMWSARGVGKMRLEKSIAVRQGMTISFVFDDKNGGAGGNLKKMQADADRQKKLQTRLQKQLQDEVNDEKGKGGLFFR
jgi:hypothetical protein